MKNVIKKQRLFSLFIFLFSLFACAIENQNTGTLVIRMPGNGNARAAISDEFTNTLKCKIVCVGSATIEREAAPGETIPIPLAAGEWEVSVTVFNAANEEINTAKIKETVTIKAGEPTTLKLVIPIDKTRCDIAEFKITSPEKAEGKIEKDGNQINVTVPAGTDRRNMSFTLVHTGVSIAHPASPCDFIEPQTFEVTAEDGTKKEYTVTVTETIPGTITGVTATVVSSNSITVSWSAVTGTTRYRIYRSTSSGGNYIELGTSTTTSFTDTGLTAGTTYYYKVSAENSGGMGEQSGAVNALTRPDIPDGVTAAAASSSSITVSWSAVTGATGYRIYRSTSSSGTFSEAGTSTTTSFTNTGLTASTAYYYKVAAYNSGGTGEQSSVVSAVTFIGTPTGVTAVVASSNSITVSWSAVTSATGYRIYRSTSSGGTFSEVGTSTTTSFTDTGLTAGTTYYYKVAAENSGGTGPQSNAVSALTRPDIPDGVTATAVSSSSITVSWSAVTGATGYRIYHSTSSSGTFSEAGTSTTISFTDTGLTASTAYYYKVAAYNSGGTGEQSSVVSAVTFIGTPTGVTAAVASSSSITVSWNAVASATGYRIYRSTSSGGTYIEVGTSTTTSFTDTGLTVGTTYYYKVSAENSDGRGEQSSVVSAQPLPPPITSPTGIDLVYIPAGTFQMDGSDSGGTSRPVTLTNGFYMGKYEVTQEQYQAVMGSNPSYFMTPVFPETSTARRPVESAYLYDVIVFCNRLSIMEGLTPVYRINGSTNPDDWGTVVWSWDTATISGSTGYRLPTEAQWEYACRAGTTTAFNWGSNNINSTQANYDASYVDTYYNTAAGTYLGRTTEVGSYAPNAWGLYDMHGNVLEWCWDVYGGDYASGAQTDPTWTAINSNHSLLARGGSWMDSGEGGLHSASRHTYLSYQNFSFLGFRLIRP